MPRSEDFVIALRPDTTSFLASGQFAAGTRKHSRNDHAWRHCLVSSEGVGSSFWYQLEQALFNSQPQGGRFACVGTSNIIKVRTGNGSTIAPGSLVASPEPGFGGLKGFYICIVPEPSIIGLGFFGLAALALLTSKRKLSCQSKQRKEITRHPSKAAPQPRME